MINSENIFAASRSIDPLKNQPEIERHSQVGFDPEQLISNKPTYFEVGVEKITALCNALDMTAKTAQVVEVFRVMTSSWGERQIGETTNWPCDVSDDGSPFEFSIALDPKQAELRILVEAQGSDPNLQSNWQAGLALNQDLATHFNVSLDRFGQIEDLFVPTNPAAKFSMWHAACFYPDKEPAFKLYLNPQAQQQSRAAAVVEESLVRLGFLHAWPGLAEIAAQRGPDQDEFPYFSIDLAANSKARVKVYVRHKDATVADLERALSLADNYVVGAATEFCQAMAAGQSSFSAKPAISSFSWIEGNDATPSIGTLFLPISSYAPDDRAVCDCLDLYLIQHSLPVAIYSSALKTFATRPLEAGMGMHSYISLRQEKQQRRVTVYLNPEVNAVRSPNAKVTSQSVRCLPSLEEIVWHYENYSIADHPFLQRLQREPVNQQHIWLILMNLREAASHFSRRLANIIARIDDERIRCILVKELNDELGSGNIERIHRKLFEQMITGIDSWRMKSFTNEMLVPGKKLNQCLEEIYLDSNPYLGVGAGLMMEVHGKQFTLWLGQEFRKTTVDLSTVLWLTLHEELEIDHVDESLVITRFVADSEEGVAAARQGIDRACVASWSFLDGLYRLCYGASPVTV
ncbi:tryptophan dimethylallyltransferase family protein [Chamaesiphon sp. VAR_48_metabat_135_sub]|uniref:tryptophan dimethylallyltransferase family protein n=1 Tax=Chamaesiphon sp. VAR_48_metabat_135_sub TaxID=2964699 RepID=UPI00286A753E|nr:tryptophan dimethylallyltransferase family protein [Chamaesiphon sp. VAR_48_metabat_135_sub]